jgi:hypothetical protein
LQPPPVNQIDLGNGLDWGYIDGFFQRQWPDTATTEAEIFGSGYRWAGPEARLRFIGAGTGQPQLLQLRVNGYRPEAQPPAQLAVDTAETALETFDVAPAWQTISVELPSTPLGQDVVVILRSTTFVPGPEELQRRQLAREKLRLLGVQVDWAELLPSS